MLFLMGILAMPVVFWTLLFILLCCSFRASEIDSLYGGVVIYALILGTIVLGFGGVASASAFISENMLLLLGSIPVYLLIGSAWGIFKWKLLCVAKATEIKDKISQVGEQEAALHYCNYGHLVPDLLACNFRSLAPQAGKSKARITNWIAFWPSSALWFMIHEPIEHIYNQLRGMLQSISTGTFDKAFGGPK